jgi:hypothetical protein
MPERTKQAPAKPGANGKEPKGIVRHADPKSKPNGEDLTFGADYTVTSTDDKGGHVLTDVEVILV